MGKSRAYTTISLQLRATLCDIAEHVTCKIQISTITLTIAGIYMQPVAPVSEHDMIRIFRMLRDLYVLCSDFSAHYSLWGGGNRDIRGRMMKQLFKILIVLFLAIVPQYFRVTAQEYYSSCLDFTLFSCGQTESPNCVQCNSNETLEQE